MTLRDRGDRRERVFWGLAGAIVLFYALVPVLWVASLSLKSGADLADGHFFPRTPTLDNYRAVFTDPQFPAALVNSLGIGFIATLLAVMLGALAAYAIVRLRFPGKTLVLATHDLDIVPKLDRPERCPNCRLQKLYGRRLCGAVPRLALRRAFRPQRSHPRVPRGGHTRAVSERDHRVRPGR